MGAAVLLYTNQMRDENSIAPLNNPGAADVAQGIAAGASAAGNAGFCAATARQ